MVKVLISDKMSPRAEEIFKERGIEVDFKPGMTPDELKACIGEYDALAIRSATKATEEIMPPPTISKSSAAPVSAPTTLIRLPQRPKASW